MLIGGLSLAALLGVATAALVYSPPGQRIVLEEVLRRVSARLSAEVAVSGIRSSNLLGGATLSGVAVTEAGRPPRSPRTRSAFDTRSGACWARSLPSPEWSSGTPC